jgi:hypothetical protein
METHREKRAVNLSRRKGDISCLVLEYEGTRPPSDANPCCYIAHTRIVGLHALDCPQHDPITCPSCFGAPHERNAQ